MSQSYSIIWWAIKAIALDMLWIWEFISQSNLVNSFALQFFPEVHQNFLSWIFYPIVTELLLRWYYRKFLKRKFPNNVSLKNFPEDCSVFSGISPILLNLVLVQVSIMHICRKNFNVHQLHHKLLIFMQNLASNHIPPRLGRELFELKKKLEFENFQPSIW